VKNLLAIGILGAALVFPRALQAQNYSINWYTIGGGGGSSSGTIGQPATGSMSGGNYALTGGFWSFLAVVQTPGFPILSITRSGTQAVVAWSAPASGYVLQQNSSLAANSWTNSPATLTTNGGVISITVNPTSGYQYFRLRNP